METSSRTPESRPDFDGTATSFAVTLPRTLAFLTPQDIAALCGTCKGLPWSDEMWRCACISASVSFALYAPRQQQGHQDVPPLGLSWRRVFFDHLWPARQKWRHSAQGTGELVRIKFVFA